MPAAATWKILDRGQVPAEGPRVRPMDYQCPNCGRDALLPVLGRPLAALGSGVIFDTDGPHAMPKEIQCRACRHRFEGVP